MSSSTSYWVNMDKLTLTDDEAAAVALSANGAWRAPLPTIDGTSRTDVAQAVLRGRRSLVVRELAEPDGTLIGQAAEVLKRLGTGPRAAFLLVDDDDGWLPSGLTVYLYGATVDDVELSHVVAPAGVHYFRVAPPPGQWLALTTLAEAIFADGFTLAGDGAPQPAAALLFVVGEVGVRSVRLTRGAANAAGSAEPVAFRSAAEATAWVLA